MRKIFVLVCCMYLLNACSLFRRSEKTGCPGNGRNVGAEKLVAGDEKAMKASSKTKYKGGRKSYPE